uniref:LAGLIDADG endonuclease n=1 Tax=Saccharomycopsis fibuligera TaxID=4944 RepID=UPI002A835370
RLNLYYFINRRNYTKNRDNPEISNKFRSYLAGLFEGDGTIWVPNSEQKGTPTMNMVFKKEDKYLAEFLCYTLNMGYMQEKSSNNYCTWYIKKMEDVYVFTKLMNGYTRTPKIEGMARGMNWINNYTTLDNFPVKGLNLFNTNRKNAMLNNISKLAIKPIDDSLLSSNAWLTGFTDADGNFAISLDLNQTKRKPRVKLSYNLEIRQNYHKTQNFPDYPVSYSCIMTKMASFFNSSLNSRKRTLKLTNKEKDYYSFMMAVTSINNTITVQDYFSNNPTLSSKKLNFDDWSKTLNLMKANNNSSTNVNCVKLGMEIRKNYNSTRTIYNWDHTKNLEY